MIKKDYKAQVPKELQNLNCSQGETTANTEEACDSIQFKLGVTYNLLYPSVSVDPSFYEAYPSPPIVCQNIQAKLSFNQKAHWTCTFFGLREAMKYELLNLATAKCTGESSIEAIDKFWKTASSDCDKNSIDVFFSCLETKLNGTLSREVKESLENLARLAREIKIFQSACLADKEVGHSSNKFDYCRLDEFLLFKSTVTNFEWLRSNADLISTWQPGFEPVRVPDYFYRLNKCEKKKKIRLPRLKPSVPVDPNNCDQKTLKSQTTQPVINELMTVSLDAAENLERYGNKKQTKENNPPAKINDATNELKRAQAKLKLEKLKKQLESKVEVPKIEPAKSVSESTVVPDRKIRSKQTLIDEAKNTLRAFKENRASSLEVSSFFFETEMHEKFEKQGLSKSDEDFKKLYANWSAHKKKYENLLKESPGDNTKKIMSVMKELNKDFIFQYTLKNAHMTDLFNGQGGNCLAETKLVVSVIKDLGLKPNSDEVFGVQIFDDHIQPVLFNKKNTEVVNLVDASIHKGLIAPVFHPEVILHQYLVGEKETSPLDYKDFVIQELPSEQKKRALAGATAAEKSGLADYLKQAMTTNSRLNFPKEGLYYSQGNGFRPIPAHTIIGWNEDKKPQVANEFYNKNFSTDPTQWRDLIPSALSYEAPKVEWTQAQSDLRKVIESKPFKEYLELKKDITRIKDLQNSDKKINELIEVQNKLYKILEGDAYVSGSNKNIGLEDLRKKLAKDNPEIATIYEILKSEREPFSKDGDIGDREKKKYFEFFGMIGPEKWLKYKKFTYPSKDEYVLSQALEKPGLNDSGPGDLDEYFMQVDKVGFRTDYRRNNLGQQKPIFLDGNEDGGSEAASDGNGSELRGIDSKPKKKSVNELDPIVFAQFIQQTVQSGQLNPKRRWTPELTKALRYKNEFSKDFVEWFASAGYRSISSSRNPASLTVSGPDKRPLPSDLAQLVVDILVNKDRTSANKSALISEVSKNYGSIEKYIEKVKGDFKKDEKKIDPKKEQLDNNFEVFKKLALGKGIDLQILNRAETKSFEFRDRKLENSNYKIQVTPITQLQWYLVVGNNPSTYRYESDSEGNQIQVNRVKLNINFPVETVSWDDIQLFLTKLSQADGRCSYLLPTNLEWEAAAGVPTSEVLHEQAWISSNSDGRLHAVGRKNPNSAGLFDMYGNVMQWTQDYYADPTVPDAPSIRTVRGCTWQENRKVCQNNNKLQYPPNTRREAFGFRVVRSCP